MKELEQIYRKRKYQLLPMIFGLAAFFVIFRIILPQWSDISGVQELLSQKQKVIDAKQTTLNVLNGLPIETVNENYNLASYTLPLQKDIVLIYTELVDVSAQTGVKLGGFSVKIGGIYSTKKETQDNSKNISGIPYINILININGQSNNIKLFADKIYQSLPLVEIKNIDIAKNDARYDVNFFYKPVAVKPKNADTVELQNLDKQDAALLQKLKEWKPKSLALQ